MLCWENSLWQPWSSTKWLNSISLERKVAQLIDEWRVNIESVQEDMNKVLLSGRKKEGLGYTKSHDHKAEENSFKLWSTCKFTSFESATKDKHKSIMCQRNGPKANQRTEADLSHRWHDSVMKTQEAAGCLKNNGISHEYWLCQAWIYLVFKFRTFYLQN